MTTHVGVAHARVGLLGGPADGYGGKAIAATIGDFRARVRIDPADRLEIVPGSTDLLAFESFGAAVQALARRGCDDAPRLLRATLLRFAGEVPELAALDPADPRQRFRLRHDTDIPIQVGLSGSSAIVVAALRALISWFDVRIEPARLVELALAVEVEELGLAGGAMDRVIQVYEGLMFMDLREPRSEASYRRLDPALLPPMFIAWDPQGGESSGAAHGALRARWDAGDPELVRIMASFRPLVDAGVAALEGGDIEGFGRCMARNFALRESFYPVSDADREMVEIARRLDVVAKQCGSGGAVVGMPGRSGDWRRLQESLSEAGYRMIRPQLGVGPT